MTLHIRRGDGITRRGREAQHSVRASKGRCTGRRTCGDGGLFTVALAASLVRAATVLMGGSEPYHSHSKVLLKEPGVGGAWEWHQVGALRSAPRSARACSHAPESRQDFGYYYNEGLLQPEKVTNVAIAVDSNTSRNGCTRFIKRSHTLGRVEHGVFGEQTGADPAMVARALRIPGFEEVELTMERGDICWFHSNLMHCSAANTSQAWRRNLITVYNSRHNEPDPAMAAVSGQPMYSPIAVVEDAAILSGGYKGLDPELNDFLDQEAASASIHEELGKAKAAED